MHNKSITALCVLIVALGAAGARAEEEAKGFTCSFSGGTAWSFENGSFHSRPAEPISLTVTDIDLERQTARLPAETGKPATPLKVVRAINANHFLEVVNEGFLNLTTIYDKDSASGTHPAVHSRHFGVLGQPVFAQYAGTCTER